MLVSFAACYYIPIMASKGVRAPIDWPSRDLS